MLETTEQHRVFLSSYQGESDYRDTTGRMCGGHRFHFIWREPMRFEGCRKIDSRLIGCLNCTGNGDRGIDEATLSVFPGAGVAEYRKTGTTHTLKTSRGDIEVEDREWVIVKPPQQVLTESGIVCADHHRRCLELGCADVELHGPVLYPVRVGE